MTAYCDSDFQYFTRVPDAVYNALENGHIKLLQFLILCFWHKRANRQTGVTRSFRAEMILDWLAEMDCSELYRQRLPSLRTIQRNVRGLWEAGWCESEYRQGIKKPYDVTLFNFNPTNRIKKDDVGSTRFADGEKSRSGDGEESGVAEGDGILLNRSEIRSWEESSVFCGGDKRRSCDADRKRCCDGEMAAKHQKTPEYGRRKRRRARESAFSQKGPY